MSYIFLDESGDLGFNPQKKNSKFFLVTIIFTDNKKALEKIVKKTHQELRKKVKKLSKGVLHCTKEKPATRKRLLKQISQCDCRIMTIYVDKSKVYTNLHNEKHVLYNYIVNILLDRIIAKKLIDVDRLITLVVSKRETNKFLNENFSNYLHNQITSRYKTKITIEIRTPAEEKSLQAVDFACWAIYDKYEHGGVEYYSLIKEVIIEENRLFK